MSDLINLDVSAESGELAAPLLPCPTSNAREPSDEPRASLAPGDNPFDRAVREVNRFTALEHDPFEIVTPCRLSSSFSATYSNFQVQTNSRSCSLTNLNSIEPDISILIEPPSPQDLSILNESQMNDSFSRAIGANTSFVRGISNPLLNISQNSVYSNVSSASTYSIDVLNKAFRIDRSSASFADEAYQTGISNSSLSLVSPPDFDVLPPSDDESDLIHLSKSPRSLPEEQAGSEQTADTTNVVKEVESDIFSLSDPKKREFALTRLLELKNLFKYDKPQVAKLLDDLANTCGLNCDSNAELLAVCFQPSAQQDAQHQNVKQQDNNLEPTMENLMSFVKHLVPDLSKIDPATKQLLHNLEQNLHRIREQTESAANKETTKLPRSKSLSSLRRPTTPDSRIKMGIPTLRNLSPRKSPAVSSRIKNMTLDSRHNRISVPDMPIANTKSATDIKGKLKRKLVAESVPKKGPLKAVIPVNNMQKTAILKNPLNLSPPNTLQVAEKNPIASSTPIIRRSFSQIKPRNLNTKENYLKPSSPRENGKPMYSPIKMRSPKRGIPIFFKAKKLNMSPLRTNNQNVQIKSTPKAHRIDFTQPLRNDKENQY